MAAVEPPSSDEELRELLRVTALQVGGPPLVASLAGHGDRILTLLLSLARTDLPARQATQLLQALRRHPSKEVRDRARRLDLDADAGAARLFLELTPREEEILALLAEGCSNEQVARRLVLSVGTVKTHVHRILAKTGSKRPARRRDALPTAVRDTDGRCRSNHPVARFCCPTLLPSPGQPAQMGSTVGPGASRRRRLLRLKPQLLTAKHAEVCVPAELRQPERDSRCPFLRR